MNPGLWEALATGAAIVSASCAVVSVIQARSSKKAKREADAAKQRAEQMASAAERQATAAMEQVAHIERLATEAREQSASLERVARSVARPDLEAVHVEGMKYRLRNNTAADMTIERVENADRFARFEGLEPGTVIPGGSSVEFRAGSSASRGRQTSLILAMVGEDRPRTVEIPPKPPVRRS